MSNIVPILIGLSVAVLLFFTIDRFLEPILNGISRPRCTPESHERSLSHVLKYIAIIRESPDITNDEIVERLTISDIPSTDAVLLADLVPSAFTLPLLKKMGAKSFASSYFLYDRNNKPVEFPLDQEHYFAIALQLGTNTIENGYTSDLDKQTFTAIVSRSWEMTETNKRLAEHKTVKGWSVGHPCYQDLPAESLLESRKCS